MKPFGLLLLLLFQTTHARDAEKGEWKENMREREREVTVRRNRERREANTSRGMERQG